MYGDLSPYEIARLKNIEANKKRLKELGLDSLKNEVREKVERVKKGKKEKAALKRKLAASRRTPRQQQKKPRVGVRRSSRLSGVKLTTAEAIDSDASDASDELEGVHYDRMPLAPEELDDHEFEVYAAVRKWRLLRKRELEIEPYKICQNRTICELIRLRRNDKTFANKGASDRPTQLLQCWGIGPSKMDTYGIEMIKILDEWETTIQKSRGNAPK